MSHNNFAFDSKNYGVGVIDPCNVSIIGLRLSFERLEVGITVK